MRNIQTRVYEIVKQIGGVRQPLEDKTKLSADLAMDSLLLTELEIELEIEFGISLANRLFNPGDAQLRMPIIPREDHTVGDVVLMVEETFQ